MTGDAKMKSESAKPLIGIVVCGLSDNRQFVSNPYIQSVRYSGGIPILLPLIRSDTMLEQYLRLCDGFLFCGGNDITPLLFGQEPREGIGNTNITLDVSDPPDEADSVFCKTCIFHLSRNADFQYCLSGNHVSGYPLPAWRIS